VENSNSHVSLLATQASIFRKLFCDFSTRIFHYLVWLKMWRKMWVAAKNVWHEFIFASQVESGLGHAALYF